MGGASRQGGEGSGEGAWSFFSLKMPVGGAWRLRLAPLLSASLWEPRRPRLGMPPLKTGDSGRQPRSLPRRGLPRALAPVAPCHFLWTEGKAYYLSPLGDARGQGFQRLGCDGQETEGLQVLPGVGSGLGGRALFESSWRLETSISQGSSPTPTHTAAARLLGPQINVVPPVSVSSQTGV